MAYRDSTIATSTGTVGSLAVSPPVGLANDDIIVLAASCDAPSKTFSWPAGFTSLLNQTITADGQTVGCAWKRASGESGDYTVSITSGTATAWVVTAVAFSGRDTTNPPVAGTANVVNTGAASPVTITANGVTASAGDDLLWLSFPDVTVNGAGNGHTAPSGFAMKEDGEASFTNLGMATQDAVSAGATGSVSGSFALTSGNAGYAAILIRIPVAGGGGGGPTFVPLLALLGVG